MKIIDISMEIKESMQVYKNKEEKRPKFEISDNLDFGGAYESKICMNLHTGTHFDAPLHMIQNGDVMENYSIEKFISDCRVLDFSDVKVSIGEKELASKSIKAGETLLFKTRNSYSEEFDYDFIYLDESGASYLKEFNLNGVGIDGLGIERNQKGHETHKLLLESGAFILEGLRLKDVSEGDYKLIAFPIKIENVEASPARAVLISE